ncbi:MAG TPA: virulence factor [Candidatus Polarisedimenticolia bacterium]
MAEVKVMYWREIPYAVRATDTNGRASRNLPDRFQEAVDAAAMAAGATAMESYQAGFVWGPSEDRTGSAAEAADSMVAELVAGYPAERLKELVSKITS